MKKLIDLNRARLSHICVLFLLLLSSLIAKAQEKSIDIDINKNDDGFMGSPWMWVVGIAVFILILVALLRPKK